MKKVLLFSDGSSLGNPGPGGWCALLRYGEHEKILKGSEPHTTNNRMELRAVIEGLRALKEPCEVWLYSDSSYVVNAIKEWLPKWRAKGFKGVKNPDLWQEFIEVSAPHRLNPHWVRGHSGHRENELCDTIAKKMARQANEG